MNKKVLASLETDAQRTKYKDLHALFTKYIALHKTKHILIDDGEICGKPFIDKDGKYMGFSWNNGESKICYVGLTRGCVGDDDWDEAPIWIDTTAKKVQRTIKIYKQVEKLT